METTVAQVSRYLDRSGAAPFSRKIDGLLMFAFRRALHRRAAKLRRLETYGAPGELSNRAVDRTWTRQVHAQLQLEQVVRLLSEKSRTILALRYAGYTWKEVAQLLSASVPALRSAFWRDVARVKSVLKNLRSGRVERQAQQEIASTDHPK
jgi:DNA-directed RNA polymerase specialized sigma24 family protein